MIVSSISFSFAITFTSITIVRDFEGKENSNVRILYYRSRDNYYASKHILKSSTLLLTPSGLITIIDIFIPSSSRTNLIHNEGYI